MTHDQTTPAPVEVTALPCAHCGSEALIGQTLDDAWYAMCCVDHCIRIDKYWRTKAEAIAAWNTRHSAPAGEVEPVLRWEGEELWLGEEPVAWVTDYPKGDAEWSFAIGSMEGDAPTLTEARTAAEQAVRDWLKRARGGGVMDEKLAEATANATRWDATCPADKRQCDKVPCPFRSRCFQRKPA